jgi:hypothetical protein
MLRLTTVIRFFLIASPFLACSSHAGVWKAEREWNEAEEERYRNWVLKEWDVDYFERPGPLKDLKTDCADAVYSMRLVYSYLNKLPFVIQDPTRGRSTITNEMSRFDSIPDEALRFRKFVHYVFGIVSTASLPNDTFPVALNRESVTSGTLILTDRKSHHSWTIKELLPSGIPHLIFNSRPASVRMKRRIGQPTTGFTFQGSLDPKRHAGFRAFRQPQYILKPVFQVPGYSEEQYQIPLKTWMTTVQKKLALNEETPDQKLKRLWNEVCESAKERVAVVNRALDFLSKIPESRCLNATQYDDYSTPNRDQRLRESFELLEEVYNGLGPDLNRVSESVLRDVEAALDPRKDEQSTCRIVYANNKNIGLGELFKRIKLNRLSDNPHDPVEMRWGEKKGPSDRAKRCPKY